MHPVDNAISVPERALGCLPRAGVGQTQKQKVAYRAGGQTISSMSLVGCYEESKSNFHILR